MQEETEASFRHHPSLSQFLEFPWEGGQTEKPAEQIRRPLPPRASAGTTLQSSRGPSAPAKPPRCQAFLHMP